VPLGVSADLIADAAEPLHLEMGGMLVAMTDGLVEAESPSGEMFGPARIAALLEEERDAGPPAVVDRLHRAVTAWQGRELPHDDQTIVVAQRTPVRTY